MKGWPLVMPTFGFRKTQTRINGVGGCLASITPESVEMSFHCQLKEPGQSWEGIVAAGLSGQKLQATFFFFAGCERLVAGRRNVCAGEQL
jgi:hypothetical protein